LIPLQRPFTAARKNPMMAQPLMLMRSVAQGKAGPTRLVTTLATPKRASAPSEPPRATRSAFFTWSRYAGCVRGAIIVVALALAGCGGSAGSGGNGDGGDPGDLSATAPSDGGARPAATYLLTLDAGAFPPTTAHPSALVYLPSGFDPTPPIS